MHMFLIFLVERVPFFLHLPMEEISKIWGTLIGGINGTVYGDPELIDGKNGKALFFYGRGINKLQSVHYGSSSRHLP